MRRIAITLAVLAVLGGACAGDAETAPTRSYAIGLTVDDSADRYRYIATDPVDIRVGDEVTFELENTGTLIHDVQVKDPAGDVLGIAAPIAPGDAASVTVRFDESGFHRLDCLVDDHLTAHQMQTFFEVADAP